MVRLSSHMNFFTLEISSVVSFSYQISLTVSDLYLQTRHFHELQTDFQMLTENDHLFLTCCLFTQIHCLLVAALQQCARWCFHSWKPKEQKH